MSRRNMREILVHILYEYTFGCASCRTLAVQRLAGEETLCTEGAPYQKPLSEPNRAALLEKADEIELHLPAIDACIEQYAKGWELGRISKVILAILRVAVYEILFDTALDDSIAVNEAVEIAKGYDEQETVAFINGILGSVIKGEKSA